MTTGDRVFADPDGKGLRVMEVMAVTDRLFVTLWDGVSLHGPSPIGTHRIRPSNHDRYPVGQKPGEAQAKGV